MISMGHFPLTTEDGVLLMRSQAVRIHSPQMCLEWRLVILEFEQLQEDVYVFLPLYYSVERYMGNYFDV